MCRKGRVNTIPKQKEVDRLVGTYPKIEPSRRDETHAQTQEHAHALGLGISWAEHASCLAHYSFSRVTFRNQCRPKCLRGMLLISFKRTRKDPRVLSSKGGLQFEPEVT